MLMWALKAHHVAPPNVLYRSPLGQESTLYQLHSGKLQMRHIINAKVPNHFDSKGAGARFDKGGTACEVVETVARTLI